jgi:ribonucleoside-diphosphate reductase beta chain
VEIDVKLFWMRLGETLSHPSIIDIGITMANIETVHNDAYEKLLRVLGLTDVFQDNLSKEGAIKDRVGYLKKHNKRTYGDNKKQFVYSLILFTLFVENVSLFSQFYVILWFNRFQNVLKDTAQQVNYTKLEELLHGMVGTKLVNTIREEYPELFDQEMEDRVIKEAKEAFKAESRIVDWILGDYSNGSLNGPAIKGFIQQRINESLVDIGMPKIYDVPEDIRQQIMWMQEEIHANNMADFFYQRPVEYTKNSQVFSFDTVFASRLN